ncbi:MAG: hypothetical protein A2087_12335 [Spirochaetes bacterium GWD1_61_31]|nr:MAG: hypothetical protein A2Y37_07280 [Spirochaetes bacterium GWB1_60_80]OHD34021.1 MAG: hypothetical protein A2004_02210 [Spirochaetes bacterium GWC1_61_12]OHD35196.1 MAG: hypothetical protein A2087_12335 [Spirochaetes bacterium GWD1_61_31]OHD41401.1 MAG: hypothetical protein A2Y35_05525 [Spirochaetes bacterium GWE1_60_18]OHD59198.1 MAG: hypothetical protein A2Y32_00240 [Spirochaetes bacterium GWF1_60_12]HAP43101.1 hypothetical protein [Spirochaetaceae bacterium]
MPGAEWPMWSEKEIDALSLSYIKDVMACADEYGTFVAIALSHYLVKKVGLHPDNYPIFFRLIESGNHWVIDTLVAQSDPTKFLGTIQPNTFMLKECFRMLTVWKPGQVYPTALVIIYGLLTQCYKMPEEGYRMYPLTVSDVNNLGKHLDKSKDQMDPLNRVVLSVLDRLASLIEPQKPMPSIEIQDVALQANNIRGKFLDMTKSLNESIPDVLLERGDYTLSQVKPNVAPIVL